MIQNPAGKLQSFRFRRWSRRAYAVFASLGRAVTIGSLKIHMAAGAFFRNIVESLLSFFSKENADESHPDELVPVDIQQAELVSVLIVSTPATPAFVGRYIFINQRLRQFEGCFNRFLFCRL